MGSWNQTCGLTHLPILAGEKVYVFTLIKNNSYYSLCYTTPFWSPITIPFLSHYNDYGGGENSEGPGLEIVLEALRKNLIEREVGENKYHDIAVSKNKFGEKEYFDSIHEQRLSIQGSIHEQRHPIQGNGFDKGEMEVGFMMASEVAVNTILENFSYEISMWDEKTGKFLKRKKQNYKSLCDDLPEVVERVVELIKEKESDSEHSDAFNKAMREILFFRDIFSSIKKDLKDNFACEVLRWVGEENRFSRLFNPGNFHTWETWINEGKTKEEIISILKDVLIFRIIESYMDSTRNFWSPQCGAGSQQWEHDPYKIQIKAMKEVMKHQNKRYED